MKTVLFCKTEVSRHGEIRVLLSRPAKAWFILMKMSSRVCIWH